MKPYCYLIRALHEVFYKRDFQECNEIGEIYLGVKKMKAKFILYAIGFTECWVLILRTYRRF